MKDLIYAFPLEPGDSEREALLLARCLSRMLFAPTTDAPNDSTMQSDSISPLVAVTTDRSDGLRGEARAALATLGVRIVTYSIDEDTLAFPLASKAYAAAAAEESVAGCSEVLAWLDSDTLVVAPPHGLQLPGDKSLACCPIHHDRIGPRYDAPLDPFWRLVHELCGVPAGRDFLMHTAVDGAPIRPHFNAGLLAVRPELGLLRAWRDAFAQHYRRPALEPLYRENKLRRIFAHQAFLTGAVLARLLPAEIAVLPGCYNYPLHLHAQFPPGRSAANMGDLVTCRYDGWEYFEQPTWDQTLRIDEPLLTWLRDQVEKQSP